MPQLQGRELHQAHLQAQDRRAHQVQQVRVRVLLLPLPGAHLQDLDVPLRQPVRDGLGNLMHRMHTEIQTGDLLLRGRDIPSPLDNHLRGGQLVRVQVMREEGHLHDLPLVLAAGLSFREAGHQ